jgi:hypothetical protein
MKADPTSLANQIVFQFAGASNLDPKKDEHVHAATLTIVDDDHIETAGVGWEGGAPLKEMCCGGSWSARNSTGVRVMGAQGRRRVTCSALPSLSRRSFRPAATGANRRSRTG